MLNDFLDLQRLESGQERLQRVSTDVGQLLTRAIVAAGEDPVRPISVVASDDLPPVLANPHRIQQVLTNLLSNARKYSPDGGNVLVSVTAGTCEVEIAVADTGLGLPAEAISKLFEKFYRVESADRSEIRGTGLGLAICRQIIEAHGGRIWAESAGPGQGSRFTFTLPIADTLPLYSSPPAK